MPSECRMADFIADESGTTAIEYCVIAAMLSILLIAGARVVGVNIAARFLGPLAGAFP